ncbi:MAG: hypothetical protein MZU97_01735 [Bacillus subtilis]|nr:hypothetical protein [Bacillus subtilis]
MTTIIEELQEEVDDLIKKGVNKIIMLSHLGKDKDFVVANKVSGIDIIIGGHIHDIIEEKESIITKPNGEKVVVTQCGKDGEHYGILTLNLTQKELYLQLKIIFLTQIHG